MLSWVEWQIHIILFARTSRFKNKKKKLRKKTELYRNLSKNRFDFRVLSKSVTLIEQNQIPFFQIDCIFSFQHQKDVPIREKKIPKVNLRKNQKERILKKKSSPENIDVGWKQKRRIKKIRRTSWSTKTAHSIKFYCGALIYRLKNINKKEQERAIMSAWNSTSIHMARKRRRWEKTYRLTRNLNRKGRPLDSAFAREPRTQLVGVLSLQTFHSWFRDDKSNETAKLSRAEKSRVARDTRSRNSLAIFLFSFQFFFATRSSDQNGYNVLATEHR